MPDNITTGPAEGHWVVRAGGAVLGESSRALELREDGHAPVIYVPREDVAMAFLEPSDKTTHCPWKGDASYFSIMAEGATLPDAVWSYAEPKPDLPEIAGMLAFDPRQVTVEQV